MKKIIKKPHISEKTTELIQKDNIYTFIVGKKANKIEIAEEIEKMYDVTVEKVTIVSIPSKKRRLGMIEGKKKGYKKAMVRLAEGDKIEILSS